MIPNASLVALYLARKLKDPKIKYLRELKQVIEKEPSNHPKDLLSIKDSLKIKIRRVCFSDIFFKEEFPALEKGLGNLINRHYCSRQANDRLLAREDLRLWFQDIDRLTKHGFTSNHNLGYINFHAKEEFRYLENGYIYLEFFAPSFITLTSVFTTSDLLKKEFANSIRASQGGEVVMSKFNPLSGELPIYELKSSFNHLEEKVEELFLKVKESASLFFKDNLCVGLSTSGILPSFEILSCEFSLREIPSMLSKPSEDLIERVLFLQGLGYPHSQEWAEVQIGYMMYEVLRRRKFHTHILTYQLLLSMRDLRNTKHADINYGDPESIIESVIHEKVIKALKLLAIQNFYENLHSKITLTNRRLEPVLLGKEAIPGNPKSMISQIKNLNEDYYRSLRVFSFKEEDLLWLALNLPSNRHLSAYYKDQHNKRAISIDLQLSIQEAKDICETNLSFLKANYEQIVSSQINVLNHKFQNITLLISVITVVLTFLAIPEEFRIFIWSKLFYGIKNIYDILF